MKLNIQTGINNEILREISSPIEKSEIKKFATLGEEMIKFLKDPENNGVGLAAPQIGINKRLIVVGLMKTYDDKTFKTIYMLNPVILSHSNEYEIDDEGCLSIPKKFGNVARSKYIKVKFLDDKGKENILALSGIAARIVQHEVDHLEGILFVDKIIETENSVPDKHMF